MWIASLWTYTSLGVDVVLGTAKITSPWHVEITKDDGSKLTLSTRAIVIATGAAPFVPPLPGLDDVGYLTSDTLWGLRELPRRLVVLGGGPIGCELAQAFARREIDAAFVVGPKVEKFRKTFARYLKD